MPTRGRPPTITHERIADAGIAVGLPDITFVGVAAHLGVSHMALYKHVSGLQALKRLVAEEIFNRWRIPHPDDPGCETLDRYLHKFAGSVWTLTENNHGLAPYLLYMDQHASGMVSRIGQHHDQIAAAYGISKQNSAWLLFTIAYHVVAVADTLRWTDDTQNAPLPDSTIAKNAGNDGFSIGIQALINGALRMLPEPA